MMKRAATGMILAALAAGPALAKCEPNPADPVPAFEAAKEALLDGAYDAFLRTVLPLNEDPLGDRESLVGAMERTFPDGLPSCASIVLRREEPGYAQEVVLFETGGVPLALYMEAALLGGEMTVMSFQYALSPSDMLKLLK